MSRTLIVGFLCAAILTANASTLSDLLRRLEEELEISEPDLREPEIRSANSTKDESPRVPSPADTQIAEQVRRLKDLLWSTQDYLYEVKNILMLEKGPDTVDVALFNLSSWQDNDVQQRVINVTTSTRQLIRDQHFPDGFPVVDMNITRCRHIHGKVALLKILISAKVCQKAVTDAMKGLWFSLHTQIKCLTANIGQLVYDLDSLSHEVPIDLPAVARNLNVTEMVYSDLCNMSVEAAEIPKEGLQVAKQVVNLAKHVLNKFFPEAKQNGTWLLNQLSKSRKTLSAGKKVNAKTIFRLGQNMHGLLWLWLDRGEKAVGLLGYVAGPPPGDERLEDGEFPEEPEDGDIEGFPLQCTNVTDFLDSIMEDGKLKSKKGLKFIKLLIKKRLLGQLLAALEGDGNCLLAHMQSLEELVPYIDAAKQWTIRDYLMYMKTVGAELINIRHGLEEVGIVWEPEEPI